MTELRFHPEARADLIAAAAHLEAERPGYGARFRDEARRVVELVVERPGIGQVEEGYPEGVEIRVFRFAVFPYSLVVLVEPEELIVIAVSHGRRLPGYWRSRL